MTISTAPANSLPRTLALLRAAQPAPTFDLSALPPLAPEPWEHFNPPIGWASREEENAAALAVADAVTRGEARREERERQYLAELEERAYRTCLDLGCPVEAPSFADTRGRIAAWDHGVDRAGAAIQARHEDHERDLEFAAGEGVAGA